MSKRALQVAIAVLALIPILTGGTGIVLGPDFLAVEPPWPADLDSHFRFLSGIFFAIGVAFYSTIADIERQTRRFRFLGTLIVAGGLARLLSLFLLGPPPFAHLAGLVTELAVVPVLMVWQGRVARRCAGGGVQIPAYHS